MILSHLLHISNFNDINDFKTVFKDQFKFLITFRLNTYTSANSMKTVPSIGLYR
jgi:hypothetical protein